MSAKDKATGKEQKIVIKASSGLTEDEIKRMVRDAEAHAEEDKKFRELADTRNRADALVHATEKALKDLGDKVQAADRAKVESALSDLRGVLKGDDKDVIETKARGPGRGLGGDRAAGLCGRAGRGRRSDGGGEPLGRPGPAGEGRGARRRVRGSQGQGPQDLVT